MAEETDRRADTAPEIAHRDLRSAIEFAVLLAGEARKRRASLAVPADVERWIGDRRIPNAALGPLRRAIEGASGFRAALAAGAVDELVDEVGRLWLAAAPGWEAEASAILARRAEAEADADARRELRRAERRREAAERALLRSRAEVAGLRDDLHDTRRERDELRAAAEGREVREAERRRELSELRTALRHAGDRESAAEQRIALLEAELAELRARPTSSDADRGTDRDADREAGRDVDRAVTAPEASSSGIDLAEVEAAASRARELAESLEALLPGEPPSPPARRRRRKPLVLPGGVSSRSSAAAEHLLRSRAAILVDGYNVAKLGWPALDLAGQRQALLDALDALAARFGAEIAVHFDGADVVGASTTRRRAVRVVYSPPDVTADDMIRSEVARIPTARPVVVVTNDGEILRDVRAMGANALASEALLAVC